MEKQSDLVSLKIKRALQLSPSFFNHAVLGSNFWDKQEQIAISVRDNRYTTVRACHDVGKGLAIDTPIATPTGWTTMGELNVGNKIFGVDGKPTSVTKAYQVRNIDCYKVIFDDGSELVCDKDHLWQTIDFKKRATIKEQLRRTGQVVGDWRNHWRDSSTSSIETLKDTLRSTNDQRNHLIPLTKPIEGTQTLLPIAPYTFGVWLGDGTSSGAIITDPSNELLRHIENEGYVTRLYKNNYSYAFLPPGTGKPTLRAVGVLDNKHIPQEYKSASFSQRLELLRGIMDSDGHITSRGQIQIDLTCKPLVYDLLEILDSLGFKARIRERPSKLYGKDCGVRYRINFSASHNPFKLERKASRWRIPKTQQARTTARTVVDIIPVDSVPTRCIEVDSPDKLFLAGKRLIPTHNSYSAGRLALWFLYSHPQSIVVTTAPTMRQVENLLWREIRAAHEKAKLPLEGDVLKTRLDLASDWYAIGASSGDPDKLQGFHAASGHILIVVDEAAGVNEEAFEAMEGMMTSEKARMLMIGNPTSDSGSFRQSHYSWEHANKIHISVFDSPNFKNNGIHTVEDLQNVDLDKVEIVNEYLVSPRWAYEKIDSWGIDSPMFQARVLGNFPSQSSNTVIPLNALEIASSDEHREKLEAEGGDFHLGVDVARFGNDNTVLTPRYGGYVPYQSKHPSTSIPETVGLIKQFDNPIHAKGIYIDVDGLGGGVYDILYEQKYDQIVQIHNGAKALPDSSGLTFANLASQLWWRAREMFIAGELAIPNDDKLIMQLSTRKYSFGSRGLTVESKDEWKKRHGGKSCDEADSLIYSLADILGNETRVQATAGKNVSELISRRVRD